MKCSSPGLFSAGTAEVFQRVLWKKQALLDERFVAVLDVSVED